MFFGKYRQGNAPEIRHRMENPLNDGVSKAEPGPQKGAPHQAIAEPVACPLHESSALSSAGPVRRNSSGSSELSPRGVEPGQPRAGKPRMLPDGARRSVSRDEPDVGVAALAPRGIRSHSSALGLRRRLSPRRGSATKPPKSGSRLAARSRGMPEALLRPRRNSSPSGPGVPHQREDEHPVDLRPVREHAVEIGSRESLQSRPPRASARPRFPPAASDVR